MTANKPLNILVGFDLSEMDDFLIQYINTLNQILNIEKVTFLHNLKLGELPKELILPEKLQLIQEKIHRKITGQITSGGALYSFDIKITLENYSEIAFDYIAKNNHFDLLILGNKQQLEGNGALAHKLVRLFPAAILLVPETFKVPVETIINAIDFSKYTVPIMDWAAKFKNNSKGQKIKHSAVHISKYHWGFYPSMTTKEIEKTTKEDILNKKTKWDRQYSTYADIEIIAAEDKSVSAALLQYADSKKANLMILGVKGVSKIKELFMGSVANYLFERPTNTCLLFVK